MTKNTEHHNPRSPEARKRRKRRIRNRRILLGVVLLLLLVLVIFLVLKLSSCHKVPGQTASHNSSEITTIEISTDHQLTSEDFVNGGFSATDLSFEDSIAKDDQGNYVPGTYTVDVMDADGNKHKVSVVVLAKQSAESSEPSVSQKHQVSIENGTTVVDGILISNKKHPLPADFNPGNDPLAEQKVQELIAAMQSHGLDVQNTTSGFRDYTYQEQLYNGYVEQYGVEEADKISARPGYSEHQTGLTHDLINTAGELITSEPEAAWIRENCADYGFIVRYPQDKEDVTGYSYEPWHLRYVGEEAAREIMSKGITLEEYLDVEGGDYA